jgi:hypothetical protein
MRAPEATSAALLSSGILLFLCVLWALVQG